MKRILFVNGGPLHRGGIETFMMNVYRNIDNRKFRIDFAVRGGEHGVYDDEIIENGSEIFRLPLRSKHPIQYVYALYHILHENEFDIVHAQLDAMNGLVLLVAKICKVPVRISHSHNTAPMTRNKIKIMIQALSRRMIMKYATTFWACSKAAGKWLYGSQPFMVIHNAIDLPKYAFRPVCRRKLRNRLGLDDEVVLGFVGRLDYQKNPEFLLQLLSDSIRRGMNLAVICVGDGSESKKLKQIAKNSGIADRIKFVGNQRNIEDWYNAFDYFILPSRFEGLGIVAVEAQANGLTCLISNKVPEEVGLSENVHMFPLSSTTEWLDALNTLSPVRDPNAFEHCVSGGYSLPEEVRRIEKLYKSEVGKN